VRVSTWKLIFHRCRKSRTCKNYERDMSSQTWIFVNGLKIMKWADAYEKCGNRSFNLLYVILFTNWVLLVYLLDTFYNLMLFWITVCAKTTISYETVIVLRCVSEMNLNPLCDTSIFWNWVNILYGYLNWRGFPFPFFRIIARFDSVTDWQNRHFWRIVVY